MDANYTRNINLTEEINKIITDLLFNDNLNDILPELGKLMETIIVSDTDIYENADLYLLLSLIEELNLSSPVLDILTKTLKYNSLSYKILVPNKQQKKEQLNEDNLCPAPNHSRNIERYQKIELNPSEKTKTIYSIEKNLITNEETIVDTRVIKEPNATSLDGIFSGILQSEVKKAIEEKKD